MEGLGVRSSSLLYITLVISFAEFVFSDESSIWSESTMSNGVNADVECTSL